VDTGKILKKNKPGASGGGPTKLRDLSTSYGILNDLIFSEGLNKPRASNWR